MQAEWWSTVELDGDVERLCEAEVDVRGVGDGGRSRDIELRRGRLLVASERAPRLATVTNVGRNSGVVKTY
jgi:hypothetical protein